MVMKFKHANTPFSTVENCGKINLTIQQEMLMTTRRREKGGIVEGDAGEIYFGKRKPKAAK